jgi:hypothetical protein
LRIRTTSAIRSSAKMKTRLDMNKIAKGLGAQRRGKVATSEGYFGAMQLLADVAIFASGCRRAAAGKGSRLDGKAAGSARANRETLEEIRVKVREHSGTSLEPMQLAALLLERTTERLSEDEAEELLSSRRRASR